MRIFKTKDFNKWAKKQTITDDSLINAVIEIEKGLVDANYGGYLYKKRIPVFDRGKSSGIRTLIAIRVKDKAFFLYGFAKNQRSNINNNEEQVYKFLGKKLLSYSEHEIVKHVQSGALIELEGNYGK